MLKITILRNLIAFRELLMSYRHDSPCRGNTWWRHQMETFSALLAICAGNSPVPGEFPTQRPVTRSFDVFFDLRLNKRLSKQSWGWWFETPSLSLWRHGNDSSGLTLVRHQVKWALLIFTNFTNLTGRYTTIVITGHMSHIAWHGYHCINVGIPGLIFQAKVTKLGTHVGLNMLIDINAECYHYQNNNNKNLAKLLRVFELRTLKITASALKSAIFLRSFSNVT